VLANPSILHNSCKAAIACPAVDKGSRNMGWSLHHNSVTCAWCLVLQMFFLNQEDCSYSSENSLLITHQWSSFSAILLIMDSSFIHLHIKTSERVGDCVLQWQLTHLAVTKGYSIDKMHILSEPFSLMSAVIND
jgi:hypothetical protein